MTSALLLLPTQEELVQRLQHTASYSGQLLLLCGRKGSGKSTLSLALASELDDHNSALVLCPLHADSAEIRRKILVQLISSPIFDDEMPLMDTVMRIQTTLTKPLHIIIDDAHLLPKSLWAECILLSQMRCAGANIAVTMAIDSEYLAKVMAELSQDMQQILLPITIDPLPTAERDGLYQSLLLRSGATPYIARNIIHQQLEKQSGTPEEVVELLNLAITEPEKRVRISSGTIKASIAILILFILSITVYAVLNSPLFKANNDLLLNQQLTATQQLQRNKANGLLIHYAKLLIEPLPIKQKSFLLVEEVADSGAITDLEPQSQFLLDKTDDQAQQEPKKTAVSIEAKPHTKTALASKSATIINNAEPTDVSVDVVSKAAEVIRPQGYTLQLASVLDKQSLGSISVKLVNEKDVYLASHKGRYVILFGQFASMAEAQEQANRLQAEFGLREPWLRNWNDLSEYRIEQENR